MALGIILVSSAQVVKDSADKLEKPTRKDVATSFTRKLIFACMPDIPISRSYRAINEVVIQREDTEETWPPNACDHFMWLESRFNRYLRIIGPAISLIDSLHVKVQPSCRSVRNDDKMNALYQCFDSAIQCTYELTVPLCYETTAVSIAYDCSALSLSRSPDKVLSVEPVSSHRTLVTASRMKTWTRRLVSYSFAIYLMLSSTLRSSLPQATSMRLPSPRSAISYPFTPI